MVRGREWTGFEAAALQEAMRRSIREYAALLGVETTTINNWRSGLSAVTPRLVAPLRKQRAWLDELIDRCGHPAQRSRLLGIAGMTSGLLGYIAVGCAHFSLARAYCQEAYQLGDYARDGNLAAWARGLQSFCEYYAGRFDKALFYAEDGLARTAAGPRSVRLAINGVARARGKLGDARGVHRAVEEAYELLPRTETPAGVPSSISLESYSPAQIAGNAATAYLSLAKPDRVEHFAGLALSEMSDANSPWGRSLVMIDVARSHVLGHDADLDAAVAIMHEALTSARGRPMLQVQRRGSEFVRDAAARWGATPELRAVEDVLAGSREQR